MRVKHEGHKILEEISAIFYNDLKKSTHQISLVVVIPDEV